MRLTKKYKAALETARLQHATQEEFYQKLNGLGFFWDALKGQWIRDDRLAEPPSNLIRFRISANKDAVEDIAEEFIQALSQIGYRLEDKSEIYLCRPSKQNEARIYLTFIDARDD